MKFKELTKGHVADVESKLVDEWNRVNILQKSIDKRKDSQDWVFYDGPIYANAKPGIHHVFAKTIKDAFCKYKTMKGYRVLRKIGLDTHGLPIEVNVEKKLGFKSKADIEEKLPDVSVKTIELVLSKMLKDERIEKIGSYKDARYMKKRE